VLAALLQRPKEVISKSEILTAAWPGLVVQETNLTVQISAIRRLLEEAPGGERWIETVARRGYRFVGPVVEVRDGVAYGRRRMPYSDLPATLNSFVGRERELVELKRLLAKSRLLTLVGPGGVGKTRLALQLAHDVRDAFRDGSHFVDLAPLTQGELITATVARALGLHVAPREDPLAAVTAALKDQQVLLVLDNCEHLLDASAHFAHSILRASREPTVVATSREPLRSEGEQLYRVQPLSLPSVDAGIDGLQRSEAARLFVDRAREQDPHFQVDPSSAPAIARVCAHLDGIPLALELAAAQVHEYPIDVIEARLEDRFESLVGSSRTAMPRQQTLRATLDWSYGLLNATEQTAWACLSVFAGGFTLEAARAILPTSDDRAVRHLLDHLVARSLLCVSSSLQQPRYHLLETLREYAAARLADGGGGLRIRQRHAAYYRALLDRANAEWPSAREILWISSYAAEIDNIRAVLDWPTDAGNDTAVIVGIAGSAGPLFMALSLMHEGRQRLEGVAAQLDSGMDTLDRARFWLWSGVLAESEPALALARFDSAIELLRQSGQPLWLGDALMRRARVLVQSGRIELAEETLEEARPLLLSTGLPRLLGNYFSVASHLRIRAGDLAQAQVMEEQALEFYREAELEHPTLTTIGNLANLKWAAGDLAAAVELLRESVAKRRASRARRNASLGFGLANLAGVLTERGELEEAGLIFQECFPLLLDAGLAWIHLDHLAHYMARTGASSQAALLIGRADAEHAARGVVREVNERRTREAVGQLLRAQLEPRELGDLLLEGGRRATGEVWRAALR